MAKVTSKLQVTVPKALADRFGIAPGDEIDWEAAGDAIRIVPARRPSRRLLALRRARFEQATERQRLRERERADAGDTEVDSAKTGLGEPSQAAHNDRGWTREELYDRPRAR